MVRITPFLVTRSRVRSLSTLVLASWFLALSVSCTSGAGGSGCVVFGDGVEIAFSEDDEVGFDDFSSNGAALGVAVDTGASDKGLVIALRFSSITTERTYTPTCDTGTSIGDYDFGAALNSVTDLIADDHGFLADGLTDTAGIAGMGHSMNALLFIDDAIDGLRVFVAVDGQITLQRTLGVDSEATVTGDLVFAEITDASNDAEVLEGGDVYRISDINFTWDTVDQPTAI